MIEITCLGIPPVRVEAARVYLVGFEQFETYATPYWCPFACEVIEDRWRVTEATTGLVIGSDEQIGASINEAVMLAQQYLALHKVTPEAFAKAIVDGLKVKHETARRV